MSYLARYAPTGPIDSPPPVEQVQKIDVYVMDNDPYDPSKNTIALPSQPSFQVDAPANTLTTGDIQFPAGSSGKFIGIRYPDSRPDYQLWKNGTNSNGQVGDEAFRPVQQQVNKKIIISRDPTGFPFDTNQKLAFYNPGA